MDPRFLEAFADAQNHARESYPKESCGFIVADRYIRCENVADPVEMHRADDRDCGCQLCAFEIAGPIYKKHAKRIQIVVHSHPDGPFYPSKADMATQQAMGVAWAIIATDGERVSDPLIWGGATPVPAILGRQFMHGVTDCYSLIRDVYRLGREELAKQDIDWPFDPIELPEFPRDDSWWVENENLYMRNFAKAGFVQVDEPRPGDVFLLTVGRTDQLNHGGLLLNNNLIMHHLPERLSRREPSGIWGRQIDVWLRYKGHADA